MTKKQYILSFIDKHYPPNHSFVDGFLSNKIFREYKIINLLVVYSNIGISPTKYLNSICFSIHKGRKKLKRFTNIFKTYFFINNIIKNKNIRYIFIRNDVSILISSILFHNKVKIIFQQSFPFENDKSINILKRYIYKLILKFILKRVHLVVVISEMAKKRLQYTKINNNNFLIIPLLNSYNKHKSKIIKNKNSKIIKYVYIGSLSNIRNIEFWMNCFYKVSQNYNNFNITLFGNNSEDVKKITQLESFKKLKHKGLIYINNKINRDELNEKLINFDVGISLIPPLDIYLESAPTKLTEYMYSGLVLLANKEIKFQKDIILQSQSGKLCEWNKNDIMKNIIQINTLK